MRCPFVHGSDAEAVELPVPLCVGLHSPQQLDMDTSDLSVAGKNSTLLDWLRDALLKVPTCSDSLFLFPDLASSMCIINPEKFDTVAVSRLMCSWPLRMSM